MRERITSSFRILGRAICSRTQPGKTRLNARWTSCRPGSADRGHIRQSQVTAKKLMNFGNQGVRRNLGTGAHGSDSIAAPANRANSKRILPFVIAADEFPHPTASKNYNDRKQNQKENHLHKILYKTNELDIIFSSLSVVSTCGRSDLPVVRIYRERRGFPCRYIKEKPLAAGLTYDAGDSTVGGDISCRQSVIAYVVTLEIQVGVVALNLDLGLERWDKREPLVLPRPGTQKERLYLVQSYIRCRWVHRLHRQGGLWVP